MLKLIKRKDIGFLWELNCLTPVLLAGRVSMFARGIMCTFLQRTPCKSSYLGEGVKSSKPTGRLLVVR